MPAPAGMRGVDGHNATLTAACPSGDAAEGCSVRDHPEALHIGFADHGLEARATLGITSLT